MTLFEQQPFAECGETLLMPDAEIVGGKLYAVIYRPTNRSQTCACPFCGLSHSHSPETDGHRVTHCMTIHRKGKEIHPLESFDTEHGTVYRKDGYIVKSLKQHHGIVTA